MSSMSVWTDLLDYPDDFAVHKPTGYPWVTEINFSGLARGSGLRSCLHRGWLKSRLMKNECSALLKIGRIDYLEKVIYLELA